MFKLETIERLISEAKQFNSDSKPGYHPNDWFVFKNEETGLIFASREITEQYSAFTFEYCLNDLSGKQFSIWRSSTNELIVEFNSISSLRIQNLIQDSGWEIFASEVRHALAELEIVSHQDVLVAEEQGWTVHVEPHHELKRYWKCFNGFCLKQDRNGLR